MKYLRRNPVIYAKGNLLMIGPVGRGERNASEAGRGEEGGPAPVFSIQA